MVDQEQLTLVVAHDLPEGECAVDNLLRAAHGQRCLLGEILERRAVAVDRGHVEVGAELTDGVLGVGAHEHLPAQPDDGLFRAAVSVVGEALPVHLDHPHCVRHRPEDVVVEEAVAVERGLLGDLGAPD